MSVVDIEFTAEFERWWDELTEDEQASVFRSVERLRLVGVGLGHPYSSQVKGSRHGHMRELRVQHQGKPIRVFYAFTPDRTALLLIGGDKTGDERFYETTVPVADAIYDTYLAERDEERRRSAASGPGTPPTRKG